MLLRPPRLQKNPARNPHTNYPRLSRLKPKADRMQAIYGMPRPAGSELLARQAASELS